MEINLSDIAKVPWNETHLRVNCEELDTLTIVCFKSLKVELEILEIFAPELTRINLKPSKFTRLGNLKTLRIVAPKLARIDDDFFSEHEALVKLEIEAGDSEIAIGKNFFYRCGTLEIANIQSGPLSFGTSAFGACSWLGSLDLNLSKISEYFCERCYKLEEFRARICGETMTIPMQAFYSCIELRSVIFTSGEICEVEDEGFLGCNALRVLNFLGSALTRIGTDAFLHCCELVEVDLSNCTQLEIISNNAFSRCEKLQRIKFPKTSLKDLIIEDNCFVCTGIEHFEICGTNISIRSGFLRNAKSYDTNKKLSALRTCAIRGSVKSIDKAFLLDHDNLVYLDITSFETIESIGDSFCGGCKNLECVRWPESMDKCKKIGINFMHPAEKIKTMPFSLFFHRLHPHYLRDDLDAIHAHSMQIITLTSVGTLYLDATHTIPTARPNATNLHILLPVGEVVPMWLLETDQIEFI